ncbi:hypothetical protein C4N9_20805 [Pararhodobacter marinus]|uniref:Uncharacterized protein n=1 Tax=Pararhodobacter marinus TaxID=2184063 RepID=A0A2U2C4A8_9RHOB|nr:hypothetical protein [Pararhodobacter marinus]PWE26703.1 hypothetical protein C4N9_20805 [Pararhodobacter marinus]
MPLSYAKAVDALKGGDRIFVTNPDPMKSDDRQRFQLIAAGKSITRTQFLKLTDNLEPIPDGLFGAETAQTYRWKD